MNPYGKLINVRALREVVRLISQNVSNDWLTFVYFLVPFGGEGPHSLESKIPSTQTALAPILNCRSKLLHGTSGAIRFWHPNRSFCGLHALKRWKLYVYQFIRPLASSYSHCRDIADLVHYFSRSQLWHPSVEPAIRCRAGGEHSRLDAPAHDATTATSRLWRCFTLELGACPCARSSSRWAKSRLYYASRITMNPWRPRVLFCS